MKFSVNSVFIFLQAFFSNAILKTQDVPPARQALIQKSLLVIGGRFLTVRELLFLLSSIHLRQSLNYAETHLI